jgi:hypothetical protein
MSHVELGHVEGPELDSSDRVKRSNRKRQQRARLTAAPKYRFPWAALLQSLLALALVVAVAVLLDWLQPLEIAVVAIAFALCTVTTLIVLAALTRGRFAEIGKLFQGPITCGATIALIAGTMWVLQRFPESGAYTDRQVMDTQRITDSLIARGDLQGAVSHLEQAIEQSDSDFWQARWTERRNFIQQSKSGDWSEGESARSANMPRTPLSNSNHSQEDPPKLSVSLDGNSSNHVESIKSANQARSSNPNSQPETVLTRFIRLKETRGFSTAELYLREMIRKEPRSNWQGDYEQWYVDHWIDWGNAHSDLDQRHLCFTRALRAARGFQREESAISAMLVDLERRMQNLPSRLPAGCQVRIESVEPTSQEIRVELSVFTARKELVRELEPKDFRVLRGDVELRGVSVASDRLRQTERNLVILIDQSESDSAIRRARAEAAGQLCENLPAGTAIQLMAFSTSISTSGWSTDARTAMSQVFSRLPPTPSPVLRLAIQKALSVLAAREGEKELIVVSGGSENSSPYTTATSLIQRATEQGTRIHALLSETAGSGVKRLLTDLAKGSGGTLGIVNQSDAGSAWIELAEVFPRGSYVLRIPAGGTSLDELQVVIGRGPTLLRTDLDVSLEERLSAARDRL